MDENLPQHIDLVDLIDQPAWKTILIDLVKSEKMDPWDIDICLLADKYITKVNQLEGASLKVPANAILASAILLKMKARAIRLRGIEEEEDDIKAELSEEEILMLEESIPELKGVRQFRTGKVSLDELVEGIADVLDKTRKKQDSILRAKDLPEFKVLVDEGSWEDKIPSIEQRIRERVDSQGLLTFSALVDEKTPAEIVAVFLPVLFLTNRGVINTWQDEWFGEVFISLNKDESNKRN